MDQIVQRDKKQESMQYPREFQLILEGCAKDVTVLTTEEVESIRLCDLESMDQDRQQNS